MASRRAYESGQWLLRLFGRLSAAPRVARTFAARALDPVAIVAETLWERARSLARERSTPAETGSSFAREQLRAAAELRRALEDRDLRVHYLPILRIGDRSVAGVEAVFPWKHPVRGWTFAERIDRVVEASGKRTIARPLARHLLTAACELVGRCQDGLERSLNLTVALSHEQFLDPVLVPLVDSVFEETHFAGEALTIEVTERTLNTDFEGACAIIGQLRERGVTVALADFSGALSSEALQKLGVNSVSIDFSGGTRTTRARRSLARTVGSVHSLNLQVTAKHVESARDVQLACELECALMQGGACSEPLSPETFLNGKAWPAIRLPDALASPPAPSPPD
jgi:EAL domain-containing protein (putative c-di-GMP-specific phosphodiesterase class I)